MFKLSKQSDYALILMTALSDVPEKNYVGLKEISDTHHLPYKFIGQIATKLKQAKLLESKEGSGGGYRLAKKPQQITLHQIITTLEGPIAPVGCMRGKNCACVESCHHKQVMLDLSDTLVGELKQYTLADVTN